MSSPYIVVDEDSRGDHSFLDREAAFVFSKKWAEKEGRPHYVYKLVADVVVETRTVVAVIEHE